MSMDRRRFLRNSTAAAVGLGTLPAGFPPARRGPGRRTPRQTPETPGITTVQDWLDSFFRAYYIRRPVNATFIGVHDHDHVLPDFSEQGAGDTVAEMEELLRGAARLDSSTSSESVPTEAIDKRLAEGFLRIQIWEHRSRHFRLGNPTLYTGEAVFGPISLFLADFAPMSERVEAATARMEGVAALLEQARENVRRAPAEWTVRAIRECEGARVFLTEGIGILASENQITTPGFKTAADRAAAAFVDFETYLEAELLTRTSDEYACGEEAFGLYLTDGHFVATDPEEIIRFAEAQAAETRAELEAAARALGAVDSTEALAGLRSLHTTTEAYYERFDEIWEMIRRVAEEQELLTWPDLPMRYVPRPTWARSAAPYLYFLSYRAPAVFGRPPVHDYLVRAIDASQPADLQEELLRGYNDGVIKLNHVIHHGHIGHHGQNWHAYRAASQIGQIAAVDCASRIAMVCGGTMAEGWASYSTHLMREVGALTPREELWELKDQLRMYARAVVDIRLHQGRYTLEEAIEHYEREANMTPGSARGEAIRNSMFPGAAIMYMLGKDEILRLRREMQQRQGDRFSLRRFHDDLLSYGSIPVSLIGASMRM